ncbi:MAG: TRAP transporter large permease subunit [Lachnospiraceae bacterium]|nr:TRAP transporter large permease subunit [Lachnospiraceae bacterium]
MAGGCVKITRGAAGIGGYSLTKIIALSLFAFMYILMIVFPKRRVFAVLGTAVIFLAAGILPLSKVLPAINWNILLMLTGTMVLVDYFIDSRMPACMADYLLDKSKNVMWVTIYMSLFSGFISAFVDNVATVLMVAPVGLAICRKLNVKPVPMLLSIAVSSNLQGAATLVGDTTSIMLGAYARMDFNDFFWMRGRPGIFFAVELGALATIPVMMFLFRRDKEPVHAGEKVQVTCYTPTVTLILMVVLLIAASFFPGKPAVTNGVICVLLAVVTMLLDYFRTKNTVNARRALQSLDLETLILLTGLFLVIEGITEAGIIDDFSAAIVRIGKDNIFVLYSVIVWGSVLISAFVDNIPYVATMLPVLTGVTRTMGIEPYLLYFGLLTGATLGGNLTPIGASANIAAVGLLRKNGHEVSFRDFIRIGVPFTLTAVFVGYVFLWAFWR